MRNVSKSPIGQRIDIITQTIEEATKNISALKTMIKKQNSSKRLQKHKHTQQSKSTSSIGIQNTDRVILKTQSTLQLNIRDDKSDSKINTKRTDTSFDKRIKKPNMVTFQSFKNNIAKQIDLTKINHNQNYVAPSNNISAMSPINKIPRNINFKSLSNFNFSSSCLQTPRDQKTIEMSPARVQLDILEVPSHSGYHQIQYPKQNRSRQILSEELKHKIAMKIRQRVQFNKLNPQAPTKHFTQNSCINLRDTLIRRVAASSGVIQ